MTFGLWRQIGLAVLTVATHIHAQQPGAPAAPSFDVVSIRVVPANAPPLMRAQSFTAILAGGQFADQRTSLLFMIGFAYGVENTDRLLALPKWAKEQAYSVAARPAEGFPALSPLENQEQVRLMMRAMLADRFHLQLHTEMRQQAIFNLVAAKGGVRIKEVDPPVPPDKEGRVNAAVGDRSGRMIANKATVAGLARVLALFLKQPVVDRTELKGYYDFDIRWSAPEAPDGRPPAPGLGTEGQGLLISNLEDQFGLRLTKTTGPVEYWVVDRVEPPTDN